MRGRGSRVTGIVVALSLAQAAVIPYVAQGAPSIGTSIGAIQNSSGVTAFMIKTNKKHKNVSIVVTSPSLQDDSAPQISILGTVSVGQNGTAIATSKKSIPKKSTISVFSGSKHLISVVNIAITKVSTLPKPSQSTVASTSVTKQIVQAAVEIWRAKSNKIAEQIPEKSPADPIPLRDVVDSATVRDVVDSATVVLNAYASVGGDIKNQLVVALTDAINARPQVLEDITRATNALREEISRMPAPVDPIALTDAMNTALQSINAYLAGGGSDQNALVLSLLETMKVFPPVVADIKAGAEAVRVATTQLPPLYDPRQAAIEAELRKLVAKAEALIDAYFVAGGSGEDEVALALLRALNSNPQDMSVLVEAMNALSLATAQLPAPETSEVVIEP